MKKLLKIAFAAAAVCALAAVLAGCSQPSPTTVATNALNAVKSSNYSALANYCDGDVSIGDSTSTVESMSSSDDMTDDQKAIMQSYAQKMLGYDFEVSNEQISGDSATVSVSFKAYDCATAFKQALGVYFQKAMAEALANAFSGSSSQVDTSKYQSYFYDELNNQLDSLTSTSLDYTGTMTLAKKDGAWRITAIDDNIKDGMTGGLSTYLTSVSSSLSSLSSN